MQINLSDDEVGAICMSMMATPRPELTTTHHKLIWKLADEKRRYDRMMAESAPLLLVARLKLLRTSQPQKRRSLPDGNGD